jgi:hypothetical protein
MKRILSRFILITLLLLGTLSVGLYVGTQAALEHYRPQLVAEISDAVGCPVTYRRATIKLTPALEVVLYDVTVMGTDLGFEVIAPYFSAEVKIQALLERHLDFDRLSLHSPLITLITGTATTPVSTQTSAQAPAPPVVDSSKRAAPLPGIESISIQAGRISRRNPAGKESVLIDNVSITSRVTSDASAFSVLPSTASFIVPVKVKGDMRLEFTASLKTLSYTITPRALVLDEALLATGPSSAAVSGRIDLDTGTTTAHVQGNNVDLAVIRQILGLKGFTGSADIQADISYDEQKLQVTSNSALKGASITATTGEQYGIGSISGPVMLTQNSGQDLQIQSPKLVVTSFAYRDPNVSLKNVNGELSSIRGTISKNGAANFSVALKSTGLNLTSGPLTITRIANAQAPLTIIFPATPGYSVTGPVTASGVDITLHGRSITGVAGSVDMLVSHSVLKFTTQNLLAQSSGEAIATSGTIKITDTDYSIQNLVCKTAGGSVVATVDIQREPRQEVQAEILAKELDISSIKALYSGDKRAPFSGKIVHLSAKTVSRKDAPLSSARGEGVVEITDGTIQQATFDKRVVGLIKAIPVVGAAVSFKSPAESDSSYELQGGILKQMTADFTIQGGKLSSKNISGQGRFLTIKAEGDLSFEGQLTMAASAIYLEQNLKALAGPVTPLGDLFGSIGKIEIPLLVTGTVGSPQISADLTRLQDISMPGRALSPIFRGLGGLVE